MLFFATILIGCDSFQEDLAPMTEQKIGLSQSVSVLPNTPLFLDLKKNLKTSGAVKFQIASVPEQGNVTILENSILHYKPHDTFKSGSDIVSLAMVNESGQVISTESLMITMAVSADSLPCFNGALSDYYIIYVGESQNFNPINNDGYCVENTSGAILNFLEKPKHGKLEQTSLFVYKYTPNENYIGSDTFRYELTLIDNERQEFSSIAEVRFEMREDELLGCDSLIYPFTVVLADSLRSIEISPFTPDFACDEIDWDISINSVSTGSARITSGRQIEYTRGFDNDSTGVIYYQMGIGDIIIQNQINLVIEPLKKDDLGDCLIAVDDSLYLSINVDSTGTSYEPYYLNFSSFTSNDTFCDSNFEVSLLTQPNLGEARVFIFDRFSKFVIFSIEEEFTGIRETSLIYEICDSEGCDSAVIYLQIEN